MELYNPENFRANKGELIAGTVIDCKINPQFDLTSLLTVVCSSDAQIHNPFAGSKETASGNEMCILEQSLYAPERRILRPESSYTLELTL